MNGEGIPNQHGQGAGSEGNTKPADLIIDPIRCLNPDNLTYAERQRVLLPKIIRLEDLIPHAKALTPITDSGIMATLENLRLNNTGNFPLADLIAAVLYDPVAAARDIPAIPNYLKQAGALEKTAAESRSRYIRERQKPTRELRYKTGQSLVSMSSIDDAAWPTKQVLAYDFRDCICIGIANPTTKATAVVHINPNILPELAGSTDDRDTSTRRKTDYRGELIFRAAQALRPQEFSYDQLGDPATIVKAETLLANDAALSELLFYTVGGHPDAQTYLAALLLNGGPVRDYNDTVVGQLPKLTTPSNLVNIACGNQTKQVLLTPTSAFITDPAVNRVYDITPT